MTQEDKSLLLKDLCARLPYDPKVYVDENLPRLKLGAATRVWEYIAVDKPCKPYLRPMSSMTEEEFLEYHNIKYNKVTYRNKWKRIDVGKFHDVGIIPIEDYLDWLNKHHFDYRGLIEKGLALEALEGMYK